MSQLKAKRTARINLRVSERQERTLRAAAELKGETLTGIVLGVAVERAEQVLEGAQHVELGAEAFGRFLAALEAPAKVMPALHRYARGHIAIPSR